MHTCAHTRACTSIFSWRVCRLDVDNLDDVGKLEASVADAMTFLIFLSAGYFRSWNCRRELYAALAANRPFILIHEADAAKGGASIQALRDECLESCVEVAPPAYPSYRGPDEMLARVFEEADPIVWVRVNAFQLESIKEIALRILRQAPYYALHTRELAPGVTVPGEIGPRGFTGLVTILVCRDNKGALDVAKEVKAEAEEGRRSAAPQSIELRYADDALKGRGLAAIRTGSFLSRSVSLIRSRSALSASPPLAIEGKIVLLLYLTDRTFLDEDGSVARLVQAAMDRRIVIAPVAEQEPSRGGVAFRQFFQQTPQVLQQQPYKLFDTLAVPLYSSQEHRRVSLRHVLRGMGAEPCDAGLLQQHWQRFRRAGRRSGGEMLNTSFTAAVLACSRCCLTQTDRRRIRPSTAEVPEDIHKDKGFSTAVRTVSLSKPVERETETASPRTVSLSETEPASPRAPLPGVLKRSASYQEGLVVDQGEGDEEAGRVVENLNMRREVVRQASSKLPLLPHRDPPPGPSRVESREGFMAIDRIARSQQRIARIRAAQEKRLRARARTVEAEPL